MILSDLIKEAVDKFGDKTFLVDRELYRRKEFTYAEIYERALSVCGFFKGKKIKKGDKVLIYLPNSSDYGVLLCACALSGVIAVPIDFNNNPEFVSKIYKKVGAKSVFCSVAKAPKTTKKVFLESLSEIYASYKDFEIKEQINGNDIFEIVYTSGTTADPKGVVLTNKNLVENINSVRKLITWNVKKYSLLSILPLSHLFEQNIGFFVPMVFGMKVIYSSSRKSSSIIEAINEENIKMMVSVPLFLSSIKEKVEMKAKEKGKKEGLDKMIKKFENYPKFIKKIVFSKIKKNLGNLEILVVGGAKLDIGVEKFWKTLGFEVLQGYGLTESSPVITCNTLDENKIGTVGKPLEGVQVKIVDGEILTKGENVFPGYYKNEEETEKTLKNGWLYTGDLGELDEEGFLKIIGRKKNMILSPSGLNIYPEDIEKILNGFSGIKGSVVLGLDSGKKLIGVVLTEGKVNLDELLKKTNSKLSSHQYLSKIYKWHEADFPRTPTKKIKRRFVEEGLKANKKRDKESAEKLVEIISDVCDVSSKKIKENSFMRDLGLDSLKRIELGVKIEEVYNLDFDEDEIKDKTKVKDLRELIKASKEFKSKSGLNILNSRIFNPLRFLMQGFFSLFSRMFYSLEVEGRENIPDEQVIFVANHQSFLDTTAIFSALPIRKRFNTYPAAAREFLYEGKYSLWGFMGRITYNSFPFSRTGKIKQSLKDFGEIINSGGNVLIYPEGTRTRTGKITPFKTGTGLISWNMDIPVVPIKIEGMYDVFPSHRKTPKFGKVKIIFGKPLKFSKMQSFQDITNKIKLEIESLK